MISEVQKEIKKLKKQKDVCILAHIYQNRDVAEIADFVGETFQLAEYAEKSENKNILLCGIKSVAETVKMFVPKKHVYVSDISAVCPVSEQITPELVAQMKAVESDRTVVTHINTTAALKAVSDVCVTSSTAVQVVKNIPNDKILFVPDCNLGDYVKKSIPKKDIRLVPGTCPIYTKITVEDVLKSRKFYPEALLLVNPKCPPDVVEMADYVGSAKGIIDFAEQSDKKEFIIGAEIAVKDILQHQCPEKDFYLLSKNLICYNMKLTTLGDVLHILKIFDSNDFYKINIEKNEIECSMKCVKKMNGFLR